MIKRFTRMIQVEFNEETDVAYLALDKYTPKEWARTTLSVDTGTDDPIVLHLDHLDRIVGIELRGAIQRVRPDFLL